MRRTWGLPVLIALALAQSGCAPAAGSASETTGPRGPRVAPGVAFARRDAPLPGVLAEARRRGRPALLFFWTSW